MYTNKRLIDFLKELTEQLDILTRNENEEAVVYGNAIPSSNFITLQIDGQQSTIFAPSRHR